MSEIETERLVLRPIDPGEARAILDGDAPEVTLADGYPSQFSLEVMEMLAAGHPAMTNGFGPYFLHRRRDDAVIGEMGASAIGDETVQAGYSIVEPAWNQGYATEALAALIERALSDGGVSRFIAKTLVDHDSSRRVMEKVGMRLVGEETETEDGETVKVVVYEITG